MEKLGFHEPPDFTFTGTAIMVGSDKIKVKGTWESDAASHKKMEGWRGTFDWEFTQVSHEVVKDSFDESNYYLPTYT